MLAITCSDLRKTYPGRPPVEAVRGVNLNVPVGQCFGLLGPNGAGKTTTMEILEGLLELSSGEVEILGRRWPTHESEIKQRIGISLQETLLAEKLTVRETLTLFRSFYRTGISPDEAIERVRLDEKDRAYVGKLSGGQRQRLAVACALVGDPELLFLDEPTTGLDPQSRRQLWEIIRSFRDLGRTVLLTTHYMDEAERLCDRVAVIDDGQVIAEGTPAELIRRIGGEHIIEFTLPESVVGIEFHSLEDLPSATGTLREDSHRFTLAVGEPHRAVPALLDRLRQAGIDPDGLAIRSATLEDVFVNLTGRHLRDDA